MTIVQSHGCFDLLHIGHIRHFEAAKRAGDYLVVTVTADRFVNKGPARPVFTEGLRMEAIRALSCVDRVMLSDAPTAVDVIRQIRPDVFAKGPDYSEATMDAGELDAIAEVGGRLFITPTDKWSSSALLHQQVSVYAPEVYQYLASVRATYSAEEVLDWLEQARTLKALVIGDAIRDEYVYCNTLGKSGKEPMLAAQFVRKEAFQGGACAVRGHVAAVCDAVDLATGPVTVKRRFIESYPFQKLFEVYEMDEAAAMRAADRMGSETVDRAAVSDLVVIADYGHGLMTAGFAGLVQQYARCFAVNTQANAGNHGFNTISKYPKADFISLSERELRLDARDQTSDVRALMRCAGDSRKATVLITRGAHGCLVYRDGTFIEAPALASHTVDRMGAGDAVFGVTAACAAVGMPLDLIAFVAAAVGTMAVAIVGNTKCIERQPLRAQIETLLA